MVDILTDTTVWIDLLRGHKTRQSEILSSKIISNQKIVVCPVIVQEVLQGIRDDKIFDRVKEDILSFEILRMDELEVALRAAQLYRSLRKHGITIRNGVDCIIAVFAIHFNIPVLHRDRDFALIEKYSSLKTVPAI